MAATVEFGLDAKQGLLDLRSEAARLKLVARLCRAAIKRLDFVDRAQARARSNGKVHFTAEQRAQLHVGRSCRAGSCPRRRRGCGRRQEQLASSGPRSPTAPSPTTRARSRAP